MVNIFPDSLAALLPSLTIPSPRQLLQLPFVVNRIINPSTFPSNAKHQSELQSPITVQQSCPNPILSCSGTLPSPIDTCCLNHPSGHFLLAQFWDTQPSLGPDDSWTIHGLWPDLCAGGYDANCDRSRNLERHALADLLDHASSGPDSTHPGLRTYMDTFFKGLHGDDDLWMHEWNKHGTCVSTLEPVCYGDAAPPDTNYTTSPQASNHADVLDYFNAATTLHTTLQTYAVLAAHNITPSTTTTYDLHTIQSALSSGHAGFTGTVKCNSRHELNEIWLHFVTRGPLRDVSAQNIDRVFFPQGPDGLITTCPSTGIKYLPKTPSRPDKPHPPHPPVPTGPSTPFEGRGFLKVRVVATRHNSSTTTHTSSSFSSSDELGCLIRRGEWYVSGTCATYRASTDVRHLLSTPSPGTTTSTTKLIDVNGDGDGDGDGDESRLFTLTSSGGACAVLEADSSKHGKKGQFVCGPRLPVQSVFESLPAGEGEVLSWQGQTVFYAEKRPGRFEKVPVFGDDGDGEREVELEIYWESV